MPLELNATAHLNVKQIPEHPAVVVHGIADVRAALAPALPVTLLSARGAALFAGCGWWRALVEQTWREHPGAEIADVLDCADACGLALGALRIGQRRLILDTQAPGRAAVEAVAASLGVELWALRPPALDMADRSASHRLRGWLRSRTPPDDRRANVV